MALRPFAKSVRRELLEELAAAGFSRTVGAEGRPRLTFTDDAAWVEATDEELPGVSAVVAAHDPAAIDAAAEAAADEDEGDRAPLRQAIAALLADAARLQDATVTMGPQVVRNHLARTDEALAATLRYLRRRGL